MNGMGKQAAFYRGYLPDDRSLVPLTVLLSTDGRALAARLPRRRRWRRPTKTRALGKPPP